MDEQRGITVTAEQLPLLRDIIVAQRLDVFIRDPHDTDLLDDQWKPWVRRIRPQIAHCTAAIWIWTPCYSWPDHHTHPRIRTIIAQQLHTCIQIAVMLGAHGIVLPIEHASPPFGERIAYYIGVLQEQLTSNNLQLMLAVEPSAKVVDVLHVVETYAIECTILMPYDTHIPDQFTDTTFAYAAVVPVSHTDDTFVRPLWTNCFVLSGDDTVSSLRKQIQWLGDRLKTIIPKDEIVGDTHEDTDDATQSRVISDDEVT